MEWGQTILFTVADNPVSAVELLSVVLGFTCVFLATRGKVANFRVGYLYNILLFFLFLHSGLYFSAALQPVSFAIAVMGHYKWTHPSAENATRENELKITTLAARKRIILIASALVLAAALGWSVRHAANVWPDRFPAAQYPYVDALVTVLFLSASWLSAHKKIECWWVWIAADVTQVVLYILAGLVFMPLVCFGYTSLAFLGLVSWRRKMKEEKEQ